jgi:hypothetical protein
MEEIDALNITIMRLLESNAKKDNAF